MSGLSESYCKRNRGEHCLIGGMRRYIEDRRMLAAMRLLGFAPLEVGTVAPAVGYRSPQSFARAFRRRVGLAPTGFRKKARRQDRYVPARYDRPAFYRLVQGGRVRRAHEALR